MTTTNWREFSEELIRAVDDARGQLELLDVRYFDQDTSGKVFELDPLKASEGELRNADWLIDFLDAEKVLGDLYDDFRRRLYSAQIVADRDKRRVA